MRLGKAQCVCPDSSEDARPGQRRIPGRLLWLPRRVEEMVHRPVQRRRRQTLAATQLDRYLFDAEDRPRSGNDVPDVLWSPANHAARTSERRLVGADSDSLTSTSACFRGHFLHARPRHADAARRVERSCSSHSMQSGGVNARLWRAACDDRPLTDLTGLWAYAHVADVRRSIEFYVPNQVAPSRCQPMRGRAENDTD